MDLMLKGKVAVVIGASKGIGYAIAEAFLKEGCKVALCARLQQELDFATAKLGLFGPVFAQCADATQLVQLETFAEAVYNKFGRIDCWVNNVGAVGHRSKDGYSESDLEEVTRICFHSAVYGCQVAGTYLKKNPEGGSIVNISSLAARIPTAGRSTLYGPLKAAVQHLSITYGGEYAPYNIRVNAVLPGFTLTSAVESTIPKNELEKVSNKTLAGRMAMTEEIANPVVFLCSPKASYITATSLEVSGGRDVILNTEEIMSQNM